MRAGAQARAGLTRRPLAAARRGPAAPVLALLTALVLAACSGDSGTGPAAFDRASLSAVFAPPTETERQAVLAEWAGRDVSAHDVRLELRDTVAVGIDAVEVRILSHTVDGVRCYGALVVPLAGPAPALLYTHFSAHGVNVETTLVAMGAVAGLRASQVALVVPAYRGKVLSYGQHSWTGAGDVSLWDGEVDDALALLAVAWEQPGVTRSGSAALGFSAGGAVALLAAAREPGIEGVVDFFAPVDFLSPWSRTLFERVLDGTAPDIDSIPQLEADLVDPFVAGDLSVADFRHQLLLRSVLHFADRLPPVLAHHGTADDVVFVSQTQSLERRVRELGRSLQAYYYDGGGHSPFGLTGSLGRTADFLSGVWSAAVAQAGRPLPSRSSWLAPGSGIASHPAKGWSPPMQ